MQMPANLCNIKILNKPSALKKLEDKQNRREKQSLNIYRGHVLQSTQCFLGRLNACIFFPQEPVGSKSAQCSCLVAQLKIKLKGKEWSNRVRRQVQFSEQSKLFAYLLIKKKLKIKCLIDCLVWIFLSLLLF